MEKELHSHEYKYISYGNNVFCKEDGNKVIATLSYKGDRYEVKKTTSFNDIYGAMENIDDWFNLRLKIDGTICERLSALFSTEISAAISAAICSSSMEVSGDIATLSNKLEEAKKSGEDKDFFIFPLLHKQHYVTAILHFKDGGEKEVFVFDSQQNEKESFIKNNISKLLQSSQILCEENLQGESGACGFFTIEFAKEVSKCKSFKELLDNKKNIFREVTKNVAEKIEKHNLKFETLKKEGVCREISVRKTRSSSIDFSRNLSDATSTFDIEKNINTPSKRKKLENKKSLSKKPANNYKGPKL